MPRRPEFVSPIRSAGPRPQRRAQPSTASRNGYLRPLMRLGTCMAPSASGSGASTATSSQRQRSAGAKRRRRRRNGQRDATSRALRRSVRGSQVASWWARPPAASRAASRALGGVARNSESATTSACQRASWRAMASARTPPPARMFHATTRTGRRRASARLEAHGAEEGGAARARVVGVGLEADPLDRSRSVAEDAAVVGEHVTPLARPVAEAHRPRADHDEHAIEDVQLVGPRLGAQRRDRVPHVEDALHALEHQHDARGLIVELALAHVAVLGQVERLPLPREQGRRLQIDLERAPDAHGLVVGAQEQGTPAVALHDRRRVLERRRLGERIDPPHVEIERSGRDQVPVVDADRRRLRRRAGEDGSGEQRHRHPDERAGHARAVNFWNVWQSAGARPRLTAKVHVTSATYTAPLLSTARPCGAAKLPGLVASGVPQRASRRPSLSKTLTRPCLGSWVTPWRREVWPLCHQSSETYARPCSSKTMWVGRCVSPHSERYSPSGLKIWMRSLSRSQTNTRPSAATAIPCGR